MSTSARSAFRLLMGALALSAIVAACVGEPRAQKGEGDGGAGKGAIASFLVEEGPPLALPAHGKGTWPEYRASDGHATHSGLDDVTCKDCHVDGYRGEVQAPCERCHEAEARRSHQGGAGVQKTECTACHSFSPAAASTCAGCHAAGGAAGKPGAEGARAASHPLTHHTQPGVTCTACHAPHGEASVVLADCRVCHEGRGARHGSRSVAPLVAGAVHSVVPLAAEAAPHVREAGAPLAEASALPGAMCLTCHAPHTGQAEVRSACESCHVRGEAPPATLLRSTGAAAAGAEIARELAARAPRVHLAGAHVAGHDACTTCHAPHETESGVRACGDCHADKRSASSVHHAACTSCHEHHAPQTAAMSCGKCHGDKHVLGEAKAAPHRNCNACHDVHALGTAPDAACVKCHAKLSPKHPSARAPGGKAHPWGSAAGTCTGCHDAHPDSMSSAQAAPRPSLLASSPTAIARGVRPCLTCHEEVQRDNRTAHRNVDCTSCHEEHDFPHKAADAAFCARCHAGPAAKAATLADHRQCNSCHGSSHAPSRELTCASCHAEELRSAPKGHARCTSCHDAHDGKTTQRGDALCASCHADEARSAHAKVDGGCASCHRPHGPRGVASPAPCAQCHTPQKLPWLHQQQGHARASCTSCHDAHDSEAATRETCTGACHLDKRDHQPDAQLCSGCHAFAQPGNP